MPVRDLLEVSITHVDSLVLTVNCQQRFRNP
jgi:hypothetical protein